MSSDETQTAAYGARPSPISADVIASDARTFGHIAVDGKVFGFEPAGDLPRIDLAADGP